MARKPSISGRNGARPSVGGGDATRRWYLRSARRGLRPIPAADNETPEGTRSVAFDIDVNTDTAACGPCPFGQDVRYRSAVRLGTGLSTSFAKSRGFGPDLSTAHPRTRGWVSGWGECLAAWGEDAAKQMPEGTRSLDAPTNVNTGQITRCSCPFGHTERYGRRDRIDKALIHQFRRRCLAARHVVHRFPTVTSRAARRPPREAQDGRRPRP
jgi:hypothetical protein